MDNFNFLSDGYKWENGIKKVLKTKEIKLCNAIPIVKRYKKIVNYKKGTEDFMVEITYHFENGDEQTAWYSMSEIDSGAFMQRLPSMLLIEIGKNAAVKQVFQYSIHKQACVLEPTEEIEYEWGWNLQTFSFGKNHHEMSDKHEYQYAAAISRQIILSDGIVIGCLLAAVHGPMKELLIQAGIQHDFTTCISGKSGIGKTSMAKKYCCYRQDANVIFSLTSDRKELKKKIRDMSDVTIVIDDFNRSDSERVINRQLQSLAEIIQVSCDSGQALVDDKSDQTAGAVHIVTTVESLLTNISTMNRCYLVEMEEPLPKKCWDELEKFEQVGGMRFFMYNFMTFVSKNYADLLAKIPEDYRHYLLVADWGACEVEQSKNRVNNTYAVQNVLFKILMDYFRFLGLDKRLIEKVDKVGRYTIHSGCQMVIDSIEETVKEATHMKLLPALADVLSDAVQCGEYTKSEKKFFKRPYDYAFLILENGYFSFRGKEMCIRIAEKLGVESVSSKTLSKELKYYSLVRTDNTGNCCICCWGCTKRLYHVHGRELLELTNDYDECYNGRFWNSILYPYEE